MSVRRIKAGTTDVSVVLRIIDSTNGTPETGVVFDTAGIDLWYRRELAASVDITEATLAALTTAHSDGGFLHINDGWYRLDLPDAACASGATGVQIGGTVTGMVVLAPYIELVAYDPYDTVRLGLTALPNAAADAAGGLPISDAGGLDLDAQRSDVAAILVDTGTTLDGRIPAALVSGRMDASVGAMAANVLTAAAINADAITAAKVAADVSAEIADAVWDEDATGHQTGGTFGQAIGDPGADTTTIYQSVVTDAAGTHLAADIIAIKAETAAILVDTGTTLQAEVDGIQADTEDIQTRLPAALVGGRIDASVGAMAANTLTAAAMAADAGAEIADAVLDRDMATGTDSGSTTVRTPRQALRALRNKVSIAGGTLTVTKEDDATASWTGAVTTAAGDPISAIDPAGP